MLLKNTLAKYVKDKKQFVPQRTFSDFNFGESNDILKQTFWSGKSDKEEVMLEIFGLFVLMLEILRLSVILLYILRPYVLPVEHSQTHQACCWIAYIKMHQCVSMRTFLVHFCHAKVSELVTSSSWRTFPERANTRWPSL